MGMKPSKNQRYGDGSRVDKRSCLRGEANAKARPHIIYIYIYTHSIWHCVGKHMNKNMGLRVFSPISYPAARLHTSSCGWEILLKVPRKSYIMWNNKPIQYTIWPFGRWFLPPIHGDFGIFGDGLLGLPHQPDMSNTLPMPRSRSELHDLDLPPSPTIHCPRILSVQCGLQQCTRHLLQPVLSMCTHFVGRWVGQFSL